MSDTCLRTTHAIKRSPPPRTPCTTEETLITSLLLDPTSLLKNLVEAPQYIFYKTQAKNPEVAEGGNPSRKLQYSPPQSKSKNYSFVELKHQILKIAQTCTHSAMWILQNTHITKGAFYLDKMPKWNTQRATRVVVKGTYSNAKVNLFLRDEPIFYPHNTTWAKCRPTWDCWYV